MSLKSDAGDDSGSEVGKNGQKSEFYGVLDLQNIRRVCFGKYEFDTWYGNAAYFSTDQMTLGYNKVAAVPGFVDGRPGIKHNLGSDTSSSSSSSSPSSGFWLDKLFVCEYCFKYTDKRTEIALHAISCPFNKPYPPIGKLMYRDDCTPYIITKVRGFQNEIFSQNLCLFGKLFLDNKSVYYNVDAFDFYIIYGRDSEHHFKPMGFFSKEVTAWDNENNLACICIFPPYQRKGLGSLLIEFLYELAAVTPGQKYSGPEFPLSPYGKLSYFHYWSKRLTVLLYEFIIRDKRSLFNLREIADLSGFRKEDILMTLQYMNVLKMKKEDEDAVYFSITNFEAWCDEKNIDVHQERRMLNPDYLVL